MSESNDNINLSDSLDIFGTGATSVSGRIGDGLYGSSTGDYDFYSLSADSDSAITIDVNSANLFQNSVDTVVGLYDSTGTLVAFNDDSSSLDSFLHYDVQSSGDYYIAVRGFGSGDASDPFTSGTGGGVGDTGFYSMNVDVSSIF